MKKNLKLTLYILVSIALIITLVLWLKKNKELTEQKVYQFNKETPITVEVDTIRLETFGDDKIFNGTFEPNKETKISSETQGKVNRILVDVGSKVSKGQTLIQLDNSLLKLQLKTVKLNIQGLQNDVNRYTILADADAIQGVQLEKATLGLQTAEVQKETLLEQIEKTTIKAPFSGIVTAKLNEEGGFAAPGVPLLQITDINTLRFTVNVPEKDINHFQMGQAFTVTSDVYPDRLLNGTVTLIGSKANMGNSFPVQLLVANTKDTAIKAGMFGKATLTEEEQEKNIHIPSTSIINEGGKKSVYLAKDGKAVLHTIKTTNDKGAMTIISSGLKEGDLLITNGFINLFDSANIHIK